MDYFVEQRDEFFIVWEAFIDEQLIALVADAAPACGIWVGVIVTALFDDVVAPADFDFVR